jgi:hypothetical protein
MCVACQEAGVLAKKQEAVNVGGMAAKDGGGLCGWESGGLALEGHEQAEVFVSGRPARDDRREAMVGPVMSG